MCLISTYVFALTITAVAAGDPPTVASIQATHDRALVKDLAAYVVNSPRAEDLDEAYMILFDKVIQHDWFLDHEAVARAYLRDYPRGPVRSLAQLVATMARADAGSYTEALTSYNALMDGLTGADQNEFAASFADSLARSATAAGEVDAARQVYARLLKKVGDDAVLKAKILADLERLDRVGKPAPSFEAVDLDGKPFRFDDLKGKYVIVDFWASWCAPCLVELPRLQAIEAKYRGKNLAIVAVSLDESKQDVVDFVKARKLPWTQLHNATAKGDFVQAFGVTTIPATFLLDPRGTIIRLEARGPGLEKMLETLVK